jgi:hypothetical protein
MPEILEMNDKHIRHLLDRYILLLDGLEMWNDNCPCGCIGCLALMEAINKARVIQLSDLKEIRP